MRKGAGGRTEEATSTTRKLVRRFAVVATATVLMGSLGSAGAAKKMVEVTLPNGEKVFVEVDVPDAPGVTAPPAGVPGVVSVGNNPTPPPDTPPASSPPTQTGTTTTPDKQKKPKPGDSKLGAAVVEESVAGPDPNLVEGEGEFDPDQPERTTAGVPTSFDPTFSLAEFGPARMGVPDFFIEKFRIPAFLLPIYQAAGIEYGIPWQILAAINEIETDYGRNLNVSSAGAMGWMQFIPSSWRAYGVDANGDGKKDPYNPVDAIFAAGRYLKAADGNKNLRRAIFAYNHADWYVDSVMLRAKLIGGLPADLISSITGLTEGRFPVAARAKYASDLVDAKARKTSAKGATPGVSIYAKAGSSVIAVNDGVVKQVTKRSVTLEDVYGNRYTYSGLGEVAPSYPSPKPRTVSEAEIKRELELPGKDPKPSGPASAGGQPANDEAADTEIAAPVAGAGAVVKERLFANPARKEAFEAGGEDQMLGSGKPVAGYETFEAYFKQVLGLNSQEVVLKKLTPGAQVIAGTVLGRLEKLDPAQAPHVRFEVRPAGPKTPLIDPKPILDGWKLLESTAIYRAQGSNPFYGPTSRRVSIGQILLMSKEQLERRVLANPKIEIYECGRRDVQSGQVDRRVLATLEFLAQSGLKPTVSSLKCGHSYFSKGGGVSEHSSGNAVDVAAINGVPILGHQGDGSITDIAVRRLLTLQGTMKPHQIITLMEYAGTDNTLRLSDHHDHIHVGFYPQYSSDPKLARAYNAVLKPKQWIKLIDRLGEIDNPVVATKPSKDSLPADGG